MDKEFVDVNGHVNNVCYVQWMQDIAVEHSNAVGCDHGFYKARDSIWVARSHHIEYIQPAYKGDQLMISTWIDRFRKVSCFRKYTFVRAADDIEVVRSETEWVYVNAKTGRPKKIDSSVMDRFGK